MTGAPVVRPGATLVVALVSGALSWVGLTAWRGSGREAPQLPWIGLVPMLLLTAVVLVAGWQVRRSVRGPDALTRWPSALIRQPREITPQRARGTLVAAQACALGGAVLVGLYLGNVALHVANSDVPSVQGQLLRAAGSAAAAAVLVVAGLVAQSWCRWPERPDGEDDDRTDDDDGPLGAHHRSLG